MLKTCITFFLGAWDWFYPDLARQLHDLGDKFYERFDRTGALEDLDRAILRYKESVIATPETYPGRARRLQMLGDGYHARYREKRARADLELSIHWQQEALKATSEGHSDHAGRLRMLGNSYHDKYRITGATKDINMAIQRAQEAAEKILDLTQLVYPLGDLAFLFERQFERTGDMVFLERSLSLFKETLDIARENDPNYRSWLRGLAFTYRRKYDKTGSLEYLDRTIQLGQESITEAPEDQFERANGLYSLAADYSLRFMRIEGIEDLNQSIKLMEDALEETTENDLPLRLDITKSLIGDYETRFEKTGVIQNWDRSLQLLKSTLDNTPDNHPSRVALLEGVAAMYQYRFIRTKDTVCAEQSIKFYHKVYEKISQDPINQAFHLQKIADIYRLKYSETRAPTDFEQSVRFSQQALDKIPEDHQDRAFHVRSLADTYVLDKTGIMAYSDEAVTLYKQALDMTPADNTQQALLLISLGMAHVGRLVKTGAPADLEQSIQTFDRLLNFSPSPMRYRIYAGKYLLQLYVRTKNWSQAHEVASKTLSLIPLLTPRFLQTSDRQNLLVEIVHLGSDAAAIALMAGKEPVEAIQLLELGRGIIADSHNDMRADVSDLSQQYPQIAREYIDLRDQLESQTDEAHDRIDQLSDTPKLTTYSGGQRYNLGQKLEEKIQLIREIPGFDRFLLPPTQEEFKAAAVGGPIVAINVSKYSCDALIIQDTSLRALHLPRLRSEDIRARAGALAGSELLGPDMLEWLWETVAGPVLDALGFLETPTTGDWPRIWWIPTGFLARFPIHTAGRHSSGSSDTVLDRAISSYSSSIKALIHSRQDRRGTIRTPPGSDSVVLLGMEKTPGHSTLPLVAQEIQQLERLFHTSKQLLQVRQPRPFRKDVLAAVRDCRIFHFAGHGLSDPLDPSRSALLLSDEPLTVASLFETNLHSRKPFLAYLSACSTGQVKHDELLDEGLHMIGACQLAGFRHVVGTLWEVNDKSCVDVAVMTYEWMQKRDMSDESVSEGLHHACRKLRGQWIEENAVRAAVSRGDRQGQKLGAHQPHLPHGNLGEARDVEAVDDVPLYWVPYVHFGI